MHRLPYVSNGLAVMKFNNLRLGVKLAIGFGAILTIVSVSAVYLYMQTSRLAEIERVSTIASDAVDYLDRVSDNLNSARSNSRKFVLTGAPVDQSKIESDIAKWHKNTAALKAILAADGAQFVPDLDTYTSAGEVFLEKAIAAQGALAADPATRQQAIASVSSGATAPLSAAVEKAFDTLRGKLRPWAESWTQEAYRTMDSTKTTVIGSALVSLLLGLGMCWFITRAISRPLNAMTATMRALAQGDHNVTIPAAGQTDEMGEMAEAVQVFKMAAIEKLRLEGEAAEARRAADDERARGEALRATAAKQQADVLEGIAGAFNKLAAGDLIHRLDHPFATEYESLRTDFNEAVSQLQETMKEVFASTGIIRSGTGEITTASDDLSRRTEQQAASLEETAAALSEITTAVKKTAEGAAHAREVVRVARVDAEKSGDVVARTVKAMSGIEHSSRQIGQIISVIDEIAFQTNLLALNAGVEAARAGDAGRGFAVVASEVRGLAQRSAEAAKEIKTLIRASDEQVTAGVQLVGETGEGLMRIVEQVTAISTIITDIASSAEEQASGLSQVNIAVTQMDQVTQQNAAMVEEATAASHSLAGESAELARLVGRFQLGSVQGGNVQPIKAKAKAAPRPAQPAPRATGTGGPVAAIRAKVANAVDSWEEF
jgi:methyl-accepting chemotaxis protein